MFGSSGTFTFSKTTNVLTVSTVSVSSFSVTGATETHNGTTFITPPAVEIGTSTELRIPVWDPVTHQVHLYEEISPDDLAFLSSTQTFTGGNTFLDYNNIPLTIKDHDSTNKLTFDIQDLPMNAGFGPQDPRADIIYNSLENSGVSGSLSLWVSTQPSFSVSNTAHYSSSLRLTAPSTNTAGIFTVSAGSMTTLSGQAGTIGVTRTGAFGARLSLSEGSSNGKNTVSLAAPNSLSSDLAFTLPSADGSSGQAMTTDGAGNLSFSTINSGPFTNATATTSISMGGHDLTSTNVVKTSSENVAMTLSNGGRSSVEIGDGYLYVYDNSGAPKSSVQGDTWELGGLNNSDNTPSLLLYSTNTAGVAQPALRLFGPDFDDTGVLNLHLPISTSPVVGDTLLVESVGTTVSGPTSPMDTVRLRWGTPSGGSSGYVSESLTNRNSFLGLSGVNPTVAVYPSYATPVFNFPNGTGADVRWGFYLHGYTGGALKLKIHFCPENVGTGTINWIATTACIHQNTTGDYEPTYTTADSGTTTVTSNYRKDYVQSIPLVHASCTDGDFMVVNVQRDASDTYGNNAWFAAALVGEGL